MMSINFALSLIAMTTMPFNGSSAADAPALRRGHGGSDNDINPNLIYDEGFSVDGGVDENETSYHPDQNDRRKLSVSQLTCQNTNSHGGCLWNLACHQRVCNNFKRSCCDDAWDLSCAHHAVQYFVCSCPGRDVVWLGNDPFYRAHWYICDYDDHTIEHKSCILGKFEITAGGIGRCVEA